MQNWFTNNKSLVLVPLILGAIFFVDHVQAATLNLSSSATKVKIGDPVTVTVYVNTQSKAINNAEAIINLPKDLLEFVSIDNQGSIFPSWVEQPRYSKQSGNISFNGGVPTPGYNGGNGEIFSVILRAKSAGDAEIFFSDAAVRANDGLGTNVFSGNSNLTISILSSQGPKPDNYLKLYFGDGLDADSDGVPDKKEIELYRTNPNKADTDGDGFNDGVEIFNSYSPIVRGQSIDVNFSKKFLGRILLQAQEHGEAWYINPGDSKRYFLGKPQDAYDLMRKLGVGISNNDLAKIPVNLEHQYGVDSDGDGLSDAIEDSFKTDRNNSDTDGDGYSDYTEIKNGFSPLGIGKTVIDSNFANKQKGKILLQVQNNGEAWYINPTDGKRYFLGKQQDAYELMRKLGLGISFNDLVKIKR